MRLRDAQVATDYLLARPDVAAGAPAAAPGNGDPTGDAAARGRGPVIAGWGAGGLVALHLAALDPRLSAAVTVECQASYRSLVEHEWYAFPTGAIVPGIVRGPDSPDGYEVDDLERAISSGVRPRPVLRLRDVDHLGRPVAGETGEDVAQAIASWLTST